MVVLPSEKKYMYVVHDFGSPIIFNISMVVYSHFLVFLAHIVRRHQKWNKENVWKERKSFKFSSRHSIEFKMVTCIYKSLILSHYFRWLKLNVLFLCFNFIFVLVWSFISNVFFRAAGGNVGKNVICRFITLVINRAFELP